MSIAVPRSIAQDMDKGEMAFVGMPVFFIMLFAMVCAKTLVAYVIARAVDALTR